MKKFNENNIKMKRLIREVDELLSEDFVDNFIQGDTATLAKAMAKKNSYGGGVSTEKFGDKYKILVVSQDIVIPSGPWSGDETTIQKDWIGNVDFRQDTVDGKRALVIDGEEWKVLPDSLVIAFVDKSSGQAFDEDENIDTNVYYWEKGQKDDPDVIGGWFSNTTFTINIRKEGKV